MVWWLEPDLSTGQATLSDLLFAVLFLTELYHQLQSFFADVMFDSFTVDCCSSFADPYRSEKLKDDAMSPFGEFRKGFPFVCERDRSVRFGIHVAITFHSCDGSIDRHMTDSKPYG